MNGIEPPHFEIGQAVLVDQGPPGEITAVKRGTVRGVLDLPPLNTWLYTVKPEAVATLKPMSPSTTWWPSRSGRIFSLIDRICRSPLDPATSSTPIGT
jgi:hypothetical protein